MNKRIILYDLAQLCLVLCVIGAICQIVYSTFWLLWFVVQLLISPLNADFDLMMQVADALPESLSKVTELAHRLILGTTADEARAAIWRYALLLVGSIALLLAARWLLRRLECAFKRRFLPEVLSDSFSEVRYDPAKRRSEDELLCDIGLLHYLERYYSANRLEGLYRGCWVAAEEIVCGGVYLNNYTSHRIKARGQWLTIRLDRDFDATIILETRSTKNRFTHQSIAKSMVELQFDYAAFAERFHCYCDDAEQAHALLNHELADKLLAISELYPDLCVIFENGCVHFLIRRRSFDRRWEYLIPFCLPHLARVANRVYGPLQDVTDELLRE